MGVAGGSQTGAEVAAAERSPDGVREDELLVASNSDWQIRVGKERSSDGVDDFGKRLGQVAQLVNCDIVSPS